MPYEADRYNSQGHRRKMDELKKRLRGEGWTPDMFERFHRWLQSAYPSEKDGMSSSELYAAAKEFECGR